MMGLLLIAIGTGGVKPCVPSFGGDQFSSDQVFLFYTTIIFHFLANNSFLFLLLYMQQWLQANLKVVQSSSCTWGSSFSPSSTSPPTPVPSHPPSFFPCSGPTWTATRAGRVQSLRNVTRWRSESPGRSWSSPPVRLLQTCN